VTDQIEFSSFYKLLNSIKEGDKEKISILEKKMNEYKDGESSKSYLEELGYLYLFIGITELYNFTNQKDLQSIGEINKEEWENLSIKNKEDLPIYLANKMVDYIKKNRKTKEISRKWNVKEGEIRKHVTKMARYITEGIIDVIE
tara:strand:- start:1859 stop:2290 length:432 start_codon:yes stop_codon:yes gene_type:complete